MNLKRGFLRAWLVLTVLWIVAASAVVYSIRLQRDSSTYIYKASDRSFYHLSPYDSQLEIWRESVRKNWWVIEVNLPDGTRIFGKIFGTRVTEEELGAALMQAHKAGDTDAAQKFANAIIKMRAQRPKKPDFPGEIISPGPDFGGALVEAAPKQPPTTLDQLKQGKREAAKQGPWTKYQRIDETEKFKQQILADFEPYQTTERWKQLRGAAPLFAGIGLLPPIVVLLLGFIVGWVVRGFRNQ